MTVKPKILIIGDSFLDEYLYCSFVKQNPEANGSVFKIDRKQYFLGGAAAVANLCVSLGAQVELATAIANDRWQKTFRELLQIAHVIWGYEVCYPPPYRTIVKTRYVVDDQLYPDRFDDEFPEEKVYNTLVYDTILRQIPEFDIVLISDYGKGMVDEYLLERLPEHKMILVDPAFGRNWADYKNCSLIKANEREANQALVDQYSGGTSLAYKLAATYSKSIVVTLGEQGIASCEYISSREDIVSMTKAVLAEKKDICGAGDTVFAALGVHLAKGNSLKKACEFAVRYAAQQIQSFGIRPLTLIKESENATST